MANVRWTGDKEVYFCCAVSHLEPTDFKCYTRKQQLMKFDHNRNPDNASMMVPKPVACFVEADQDNDPRYIKQRNWTAIKKRNY